MSRIGDALSKRIFYIPAVAYLIAFALVPLAISIYLSTPSSNLSSYVELFQLTDFPTVVGNTLFFAVGTAFFASLTGMAFAILVDSRKRAKRAISLVAYLPYMIPFTASALVWATLYNPGYGPVDPILKAVGLPTINWMGPSLQLYSLTLVSVWAAGPLAFLIILAGLTSVPKQVKEAASVDGMGMWDYYSSVALPLAKGAVITAFLMIMILAFGDFDLPYILSGAGGVPPIGMATLVTYGYAEMFYTGLQSQGIATSIVVALLASIPGLLLIRTTLGGSKKGMGRSRLPAWMHVRLPNIHLHRPSLPRFPNTPFKYIIYAFCALAAVFILFPVYWMFLVAFRPQSLDFLLPPIIYPTKIITGVFLTTVSQASPEIITTLAVSGAVTLLTVVGGQEVPGPSANQVLRQLQYNGIPAKTLRMELDGRSTGEAVLAAARAEGCDLLVKGAFTRHRLRQMIFGGATSHIMEHAELPVLMAH